MIYHVIGHGPFNSLSLSNSFAKSPSGLLRGTVHFIVLPKAGKSRACKLLRQTSSMRTEEERKAKSSFFNWWYLGLVFGATSATLGVVYLQVKSTFEIPTELFIL